MKRNFKFGYKAMLNTILALSLSVGAAFSQSGKEVVSDTTEITIGKKMITIIKDSTDKKDVHWSSVPEECDTVGTGSGKEFKRVEVTPIGIDLGMNFLTNKGNFNLPNDQGDYEIEPLRSTHVGLHVLPTRINFGKGHVSLLTAVTFDNNRYQFRNNRSPQAGLDSLVMGADSVNLLKNKLVTWYAQMPLMLTFQTNPAHPEKNFHVSVGGYAGLFLGAKTKQNSVERGVVKQGDDFNLNQFRYGVSARIGYRGIELYANYQLSNLFADGEGPAINPFNVGIALTGFM
jgi:hypothetical protein